MTSSSATARLLRDEGREGIGSKGSDESFSVGGAADAISSIASTLNVPSFSRELYAITSRIAGRINAASVPAQEYEELLRERQRLLDKKFAGSATRKELNRLEYVRWSLDRIEDAKYGQDLETLEGAVESYERLFADIESLTREIASHRRGIRR